MTLLSPSKRYKILLIEDNPLDAELARGRLNTAAIDFDLTVVDTRAGFEEAYPAGNFDLILADYSLPDFDGLTALQIVRATDKRLPFVFVSGVLGEDVAVETLLRGATDYVIKQKLDRLVPAVHRALTEHAEFTSRERAEQELRQVEERFKKLTNSLPAMVWTCDADGRLTFVNSLWERSVGAARLWFDAEVVHPSDLDNCERVWREAQSSGQPFELDCRFRMAADGSYRWQLVRAIPVEDSGRRRTEWVGTCTDTELQRLREEQLRTTEKLALTGRMASVIAHEINNPLEAITNLLYLMRFELPATPESQHYLDMAEHELVRISAITKQTLQWSREEENPTEISAQSLLEEALKLFTGKLANKSIRLDRQIDSTVRFRVIPGEIRQVLANLISNAIDAVEIGGTIVVSVRSDFSPEQKFAEVAIVDNGSGIPADRIAKLFRPFQSTKGALGNGLGLYISKEIVERHGGRMQVDSHPGHGTRMTVLLPLASFPEISRSLPEATAGEISPHLAPRTAAAAD